MQYSKPEDGLRITTPVYIGTDEMIAKMQACDHDQFRQTGAWAPHEVLPGVEMTMEACIDCGAVRAVVRGPEELLVEGFAEGTDAQWGDPERDDDDE